jgi:DNA-binding MarR family transcriptional regulator
MKDPVSFQTTVHVRDTCLCLHAQRAARVLARRFDGLLRPTGLTNAQFSLLMALNRPEPATIRPLAALLGADRTTLTAALKPLQREGLVMVEPDPDDRRGRRVRLTPAGAARLAAAVPIWAEGHAALEKELDDPDALRAGLLALAGRPA